jgi:hypothetical protein
MMEEAQSPITVCTVAPPLEVRAFSDLGDVKSYNDTGLDNGQTYYYKVSAISAAGEGPQSNEASATPAAVPSAPQNLTATAYEGGVNLTWLAPSADGGRGIANYTIYRSETSGEGTLLATIGVILNYTDLGLTNGHTYYYTVAAVNSEGEGPRSAEVSAIQLSSASGPRRRRCEPADKPELDGPSTTGERDNQLYCLQGHLLPGGPSWSP